MSQEFHDRYILRLPSGWRETIKRVAKANRRSMNQEILLALEPLIQREASENEKSGTTA